MAISHLSAAAPSTTHLHVGLPVWVQMGTLPSTVAATLRSMGTHPGGALCPPATTIAAALSLGAVAPGGTAGVMKGDGKSR